MKRSRTNCSVTRSAVCASCAFILTAGSSARAQVASTQPEASSQSSTNEGLAEIVVTAQRREQSLQNVPIAVTALTADTLQANRVTTVADLSGLAPGVIVRPTSGGTQIPAISMRGAISYGVAPGSDKEVSIYLDGVYISSTKGSIFDLPDLERIEVLRGPQGTLFGRNATAGAVSISTRNPTGKFGVKQEFTVGNYDQFRSRTSVDLPAVGPFSAYATYVHNYKRGDIRNAGAGQVWDRTAAPGGTIGISPKYLGTRDSDTIFAALKFQPSDAFTTVYKYDHASENGTPDATAFVGLNTAAPGVGPLLVPVFQALLSSQPGPVYIASDGKRPDVVNNSWVVPTRQRNSGHSLTSTLKLASDLSFKNILAYRESSIVAVTSLDGLSGLTFTQPAVLPLATFQAIAGGLPASLIPKIAAGLQSKVGQQFLGIASTASGNSRQWSDELQANYNSRLLTLTAGGVWFHSRDQTNPLGLPNSVSFSVNNGVLGVAGTNKQGVNYNRQTSLAAYAQAELHVTSNLDVVGGVRVTQDKKSGEFVYGAAPALTTISFDYNKTKPSYLIGVNYKPTADMLIYGKFSTAFVSGGSVGGISFAPETATSYEAGFKADLLRHRLRTNLALFHVRYEHFQTAQTAATFPNLPNSAVLGTIVIDQGGPVTAKGAEFELTAAPARGISTGGNLSYTDTQFKDVNPVLISQARGEYDPTYRAKWTGGVWGQLESEPLFDNVTALLRVDASFHSKFYFATNRALIIPAFAGIYDVSSSWTVNGRLALRGFQIGASRAEVALWGKNLTQNREADFALNLISLIGTANFVPARTYGLDLSVQF